jgi:hypothetical protein
MRGILLVFPNPAACDRIRAILADASLPVLQTWHSGSSLLRQFDQYAEGGVIILPSYLPDVLVPELFDRLPDSFDFLVLQSYDQMAEYDEQPGLVILNLPLPPAIMTETAASLLETRQAAASSWQYRTHAPAGRAAPPAGVPPPPRRTPEDERVLRDAKHRLMADRHISEDQAHRFLLRQSMATGIRLLEIARKILDEGQGQSCGQSRQE